MMDARTAAFRALNSVDAGAHVERALNRVLADVDDERDRGLASQLTYGVLRWRGKLDFELNSRLQSKTDPKLLNILRTGLYQLRYLERVPEHAAIHAAVEQAKAEGLGFASGMVNAVLRRAQREGAVYAIGNTADYASRLACEYAHPEWLVRGWLEQYGTTQTIALLGADQEQAGHCLRIRRGEVEGAAGELLSRGVPVQEGRYAPSCLRAMAGNPQAWPQVERGDWVLQDEAAQCMANLLPSAERHLDLCAAPGGKAFLLADRDPEAYVVAVDADASRLNDLESLAARLALRERVRVVHADARRPVLDGEEFPSVLVDAPCSGLGTLRRHPDRKWREPPSPELPGLQRAILAQAARQTAPGGHLLYVTCTIWKPENEEVVAGFEADHPSFTRVQKPHPFADDDGLYRSRPDVHGTDGFFAALWQRIPAGLA